MSNSTNNTIISKIDFNKGIDVVSSASRIVTENIMKVLSDMGLEVSVRFASTLVLFISLLIIFIGIKIGKPLIKWLLIILASILIIGIIMPTW